MNTSSDMNLPIPFQVGGWQVDPNSGRMLREGVEVKLEPKVMEVLVYLAQHPGEVISREALEARAWAGTVVGYDAVSQSIIKLRKALMDDSRNPKFIETISKKGYRLIAPVSQGASEAQAPATFQSVSVEQPSPTANKRKKLLATWLGIVVTVGLLLFLAIGPETSIQPTSTFAKTPSIVVLPFKNLSNDPSQEYFSDGITDDLITDLSRVDSIRVIARQSSYHYKHNPIVLEDIARQLDVLYIIEGSVRKSGKRIRVNVQLTNTMKGESIWAKRFDTDTDDIFKIQDDITKSVIDAMYVTLSSRETGYIETRGTKNFEAYDAFLIGQQHIGTRSRQGFDLTMNAYRRAIQIDPNYARAYGAMAVTLTRGYRYQWTDLSLMEARERALDLAKKAVVLNQSTPQIYWSLGYVHVHRREFDDAEAAAKQSVALSPNYADGYALLANIANWRGKATDSVNYIKRATALNPYHTFQYPSTLGLAYYNLGRYEEASTTLREALDRNESALNPRLFLAAAYVRLDLMEEATWEIEQISANRPDVTLQSLSTILPYENKKHMDALLEDLRKAGLPE
jgi:TolB-like protein/DNA-binding winged helix-turn-helix (wHTH) protein/tetratricopeptide (TPR) repeat protein